METNLLFLSPPLSNGAAVCILTTCLGGVILAFFVESGVENDEGVFARSDGFDHVLDEDNGVLIFLFNDDVVERFDQSLLR